MKPHRKHKRNESLRNLRHTLKFSQSVMGKIGELSESSVKAIELGRRKLPLRSANLYRIRLGVALRCLIPGNDGHVELSSFDRAWWRRLKGKERRDWTYVKGDIEFHHSLTDELCENQIKLANILSHGCLQAAYDLDSISNHNRAQTVAFEFIEAISDIVTRHRLGPTLLALRHSPAIKKQIDDLLELQRLSAQRLLEKSGILEEERIIQSRIRELQGGSGAGAYSDGFRTAIRF